MSEPHQVKEGTSVFNQYRDLQIAQGSLHELRTGIEKLVQNAQTTDDVHEVWIRNEEHPLWIDANELVKLLAMLKK